MSSFTGFNPQRFAPGAFAAISAGTTTAAIAGVQGVREQTQRLMQANLNKAARKLVVEITSTYQDALDAALLERDFAVASDHLQSLRLAAAQAKARHVR